MAISETTIHSPRLSVLLPVYNGEKFIAEAVRSVLAQTYCDFELVIIDDGSTDRTAEILQRFSDLRLRVLRFDENHGLVAALNHGLAASRSELLARMDADDICLPQRFERQINFLDAHPEVVLCGTWTQQFGTETCVRRPPTESRAIHARLFFGWAIDHPSIMFRRALIERYGLRYDAQYRHVEDFDFFLRAADQGNLANLPEVLLRTRAHADEISVIHEREQIQIEKILFARELHQLIPDATGEETDWHVRMLHDPANASDLPRIESWLLRLAEANRRNARYDPDAFQNELRSQWYRSHCQAIKAGLSVLSSYGSSPLAAPSKFRLRAYGALAAKFIRLRLLEIARRGKCWIRQLQAEH